MEKTKQRVRITKCNDKNMEGATAIHYKSMMGYPCNLFLKEGDTCHLFYPDKKNQIEFEIIN